MDPLNPSYRSIDGIFFSNPVTNLIQYPTGRAGSYGVPDGVTSIETEAFRNSSGLTNVTFPSSLTYVGGRSFEDCPGLTDMTIPDSVTYIGDRVFLNRSNLLAITIGSSVVRISTAAFNGCTSLAALYCRGSAPSIDDSAFSCYGIATVYYLPSAPYWGPTIAGRPTSSIDFCIIR